MRSRQEHIDLMWGDVEMKATSTGEQYLEYNERQTKTRQGQSGSTRKFSPKMFAVPGIHIKVLLEKKCILLCFIQDSVLVCTNTYQL